MSKTFYGFFWCLIKFHKSLAIFVLLFFGGIAKEREKYLMSLFFFTNPCQANSPFLYLLKTSENQRFPDVISGYAKRALLWNGSRDHNGNKANFLFSAPYRCYENMGNFWSFNSNCFVYKTCIEVKRRLQLTSLLHF